MAETLENFPLFPLGLVLLPGESVPLHIFEERYKTMVEHCLATESEFGIVWLADDGLRTTGCAAAITRVLERMEDGRLNVLVMGTRAIRIRRRIEDLPYPAGEVEVLEDDDPALTGDVDPDVLDAARERYAELVRRVTDESPDEDTLDELSAYAMAASVDIPLADKQELLEMRAERERLQRVLELLGGTMERLERAEQAGELARSNGRVRH